MIRATALALLLAGSAALALLIGQIHLSPAVLWDGLTGGDGPAPGTPQPLSRYWVRAYS